jgi:hypothetical protein
MLPVSISNGHDRFSSLTPNFLISIIRDIDLTHFSITNISSPNDHPFHSGITFAMSDKRPTNFDLRTLLPLALICSTVGHIVLLPTLFSLLFLCLIEALRIFNNVLKRLEDDELQYRQKIREDEIALITARITKDVTENFEKQIALLKEERDFSERRRSEEFDSMAKLIYDEGAVIQALAREEREKTMRQLLVPGNQEGREAAGKTPKALEGEKIPEREGITRTKEQSAAAVVQAEALRDVNKERTTHSKRGTRIIKESPRSPTNMLPSWVNNLDPRSEDFTCVGTTLKGLRCKQKMISNNFKNNAAARLEVMRSSNPGETFMFAKLLELADWMLCPRWHKTGKHAQGEKIAQAWYHELQAARHALAGSRVPSTPSVPRFKFSGSTSPSSHKFSFTPSKPHSSSTNSLTLSASSDSSSPSSRFSSSSSLSRFSSNATSPSSSIDEDRQEYMNTGMTMNESLPSKVLENMQMGNGKGSMSRMGRVYLTPTFEAMAG